jgi:Kef-type K+ transport system membrane component KefB
VNASGGLTALYVFLASVAWTLFLLFPVKWGFYRLAVASGSIENGQPTPGMMILTLLIVFVSAFMTDILGKCFRCAIIVPSDMV